MNDSAVKMTGLFSNVLDSSSPNVSLFLSGIYMITFAASGLFFLKFWKATRDRFFLMFALSCWLLASERLALLFLNPFLEAYTWVYLIRLSAFLLILAGIVDRNRVTRR